MDIKDARPGGGGAKGVIVLYHDEGDTTWSEAEAAHMRGWNASTGTWDRITVDATTGGILVTTAS